MGCQDIPGPKNSPIHLSSLSPLPAWSLFVIPCPLGSGHPLNRPCLLTLEFGIEGLDTHGGFGEGLGQANSEGKEEMG
jgi:hypothetical protein